MTAAAIALDAPKRSLPVWVTSVVGIVGLLVLWQLVGATIMSKSGTVPTPTEIVSQMHKDGWSFYWNNASTTVGAAAKGWFYGNLLAIGLALVVLVVPIVERPVLQLGIVSYCLPV